MVLGDNVKLNNSHTLDYIFRKRDIKFQLNDDKITHTICLSAFLIFFSYIWFNRQQMRNIKWQKFQITAPINAMKYDRLQCKSTRILYVEAYIRFLWSVSFEKGRMRVTGVGGFDVELSLITC